MPSDLIRGGCRFARRKRVKTKDWSVGSDSIRTDLALVWWFRSSLGQCGEFGTPEITADRSDAGDRDVRGLFRPPWKGRSGIYPARCFRLPAPPGENESPRRQPSRPWPAFGAGSPIQRGLRRCRAGLRRQNKFCFDYRGAYSTSRRPWSHPLAGHDLQVAYATFTRTLPAHGRPNSAGRPLIINTSASITSSHHRPRRCRRLPASW